VKGIQTVAFLEFYTA